MYLSVHKKHWIAISIISFAFIISPFNSIAQSPDAKYSQKNWQLMDLQQDSVYGTSVTKAYNELLKGKKAHRVTVAVIDAGLDTAHEDLQGHIWINKKEIAGNGMDDDHNGYADDIHGWNFIGGAGNKNITSESLEYNREYYRLHAIYGNVSDSNTVPADKKSEYDYWLKLSAPFSKDSSETAGKVQNVSSFLSVLKDIENDWEPLLQKNTVYIGDIKSAMSSHTVNAQDSTLGAKAIMLYERNQFAGSLSLEDLYENADHYLISQQNSLASFTDDPNANRAAIVGDNPFDITDTHYGNNNVAAGVPSHGTHVAGIIAAIRGNGIGIDGITDNVDIMPVRAVPDGDERDKDIALAIRYAVDNGAEIINMSFGKPYSPGKQWVDDAVKYADKKGVLLIHAAGNDGKDLDTSANFPTPVFLNSTAVAPNMITVGASTGGPDTLLAANFSNYGKQRVDVFAPGKDILSTVPGNKYESYSGTSMATPVVAGIAALILEYYPKLSAEQVKYVIEKSVTTFPSLIVQIPGGDNKAAFSSLSVTGGIVNAYSALKLAATLKGKRRAKDNW